MKSGVEPRYLPNLILRYYLISEVRPCNRLFDLPNFGYSCLQLVVGTDPPQGIYRRN